MLYIKDLTKWPQILLQIQLIHNITSFSITGKIPNKVAYNFTLHRLLDLLNVLTLSQPLGIRAKIFNAIFFTISNQKAIYN